MAPQSANFSVHGDTRGSALRARNADLRPGMLTEMEGLIASAMAGEGEAELRRRLSEVVPEFGPAMQEPTAPDPLAEVTA